MIADLIDRLRIECPELAAVDDPTRINPLEMDAYPVATVHLANAIPGDAMMGAAMETRRYEVRITASSNDQFEDARKSICRALDGYRPAGAAKPCTFVGGEVLQISGPYIQWRDLWQFATCLY